MARNWDAVVIGGGHNGLVCASYLARDGLNVLLLEARESFGGAVGAREFHPGFRVDAGAHRLGWFQPDVVNDLDLAAHGFDLEWPDPATVTFTPDGKPVPVWCDPEQAGNEFGRLADRDAARWPEFVQWVSKVSAVVARLREMEMPDLPDPAVADLPTLLGLGLRWRSLGRRDMGELLRALPMPLADLTEDWLDGELARGVVAAGALIGVDQGPLAQGTGLPLFLDHVRRDGGSLRPVAIPQGGMESLVQALEGAARGAGVTMRTGARVERIIASAGAVRSVVLDDGEEIVTKRVISNVDPTQTFLGLVDPAVLDPEFVRGVQNIRCRGITAKMHLALDRLPLRAEVDAKLFRGVGVWAPSVQFLERAHDAAKYGAPSSEPMLEFTIPTLRTPSLAPPDKHVLSVIIQWIPYARADGGWDVAAREAVAESVLATLDRVFPGLRDSVIAWEVLVPPDLEAEFGLPRGDVYHGQPALDQMFFMRPMGGWARYRTPLRGLYLCGVGTHPGGGVTGASGRFAAGAVRNDARRGV